MMYQTAEYNKMRVNINVLNLKKKKLNPFPFKEIIGINNLINQYINHFRKNSLETHLPML